MMQLTQKHLSHEDFATAAFRPVFEQPAFYYRGNEEGFNEITPVPNRKVLVDNSGEYISTVGSNYSIVQSEDYFDTIISSLNEGGIGWKPKTVYNDGRAVTMIVTLPEFELFSGTDEQQDFELRIRNSFDTSLSAMTEIGFMRLVCTNGMMAFESDFRHRMIHKGDINKKAEQAIQMYQDLNGVYRSTQDQIIQMSTQKTTVDNIVEYINEKQEILPSDRAKGYLINQWETEREARNLWALYNVFTYVISHQYGRSFIAKSRAMKKLNSEARTWADTLSISSQF